MMRELLPHAGQVAALLKVRNETIAAGLTGNRYGDPAGHTCIAVAGQIERAITLDTGTDDSLANMHAFVVATLQLMAKSLGGNQHVGAL